MTWDGGRAASPLRIRSIGRRECRRPADYAAPARHAVRDVLVGQCRHDHDRRATDPHRQRHDALQQLRRRPVAVRHDQWSGHRIGLLVGQGLLQHGGRTAANGAGLPVGGLFRRRPDQGLWRDAAVREGLQLRHLYGAEHAPGFLRQLVCLASHAARRVPRQLRQQFSPRRSGGHEIRLSLDVDGRPGMVHRRAQRRKWRKPWTAAETAAVHRR